MQVYMQCSFCGLFKKISEMMLYVVFVVCFHLYLSILISLCVLSCSSHVRLFSAPWTVALQARILEWANLILYTHTHT